MKIVIDNNIILDALLKRTPFNDTAEKILLACVESHEGCITANSLTDIYYILRKITSVEKAKASVKKLMELFIILTVGFDECANALLLPTDDFEDALIIECAKETKADFIVTRDKQFQQVVSQVKIISPEDIFLLL
jgi:predicted nucleic acid-binding protein